MALAGHVLDQANSMAVAIIFAHADASTVAITVVPFREAIVALALAGSCAPSVGAVFAIRFADTRVPLLRRDVAFVALADFRFHAAAIITGLAVRYANTVCVLLVAFIARAHIGGGAGAISAVEFADGFANVGIQSTIALVASADTWSDTNRLVPTGWFAYRLANARRLP